jgi:hypothetical protein
MPDCPEGYELFVLSERWITRNNFTYLHRIQRCEKVSDGSISDTFYIVCGICLVAWICLIVATCLCSRSQRVSPQSLSCPEGSSTISKNTEEGPSLCPKDAAAAAASAAILLGEGN